LVVILLSQNTVYGGFDRFIFFTPKLLTLIVVLQIEAWVGTRFNKEIVSQKLKSGFF